MLAGSWLRVLKSLTPCSSDMGPKQHAFGGMGTRIKSRGTKPLCYNQNCDQNFDQKKKNLKPRFRFFTVRLKFFMRASRTFFTKLVSRLNFKR